MIKTNQGSSSPASRDPQLARRLQALPVGWAAVLLIVAATVWAVIASLTGFDYAAAAFIVVTIAVGAMLGVAAWDLVVTVFARRLGETLALPYSITFDIPRRLVPFLTPIAFVLGILIGHWFWS